MHNDPITFYMFVIFAGAALVATLGLYARQSLLVVYILLGVALGPSALNYIPDPEIIRNMSKIGIIFLLFLLGINLKPQKLLHSLRTSVIVTVASSLLFFTVSFVFSLGFGFAPVDSLIIGSAMMFSSTIISLKLLPTTVLHHQHMGEIIIGILLLQDFIAIIILMLLPADWDKVLPAMQILKLVVSLFGLILFAWLFERYVLIRLIGRFDRIKEYIFLMAIGWCLSMAQLAQMFGLSAEIGAFIAGIVLATNPIALYIAESLKPLRDFFLVIFFFALGASFNLGAITEIWFAGTLLALLLLVIKPICFDRLFRLNDEVKNKSTETGVRLGQTSEFSLFIAVLALELGVISQEASYLIQLSTMLTFVISSWFIVLRYPSPIAVSDKLRRD
jgi:Kef-type K+ transport system membrane component KefB